METFQLEYVTKDTVLCNITEFNRLKKATLDAVAYDYGALESISEWLVSNDRDDLQWSMDEFEAVLDSITDPLVFEYYRDWLPDYKARYDATDQFLADEQKWTEEYYASEEHLGDLGYIAKEDFPHRGDHYLTAEIDLFKYSLKPTNIPRIDFKKLKALIIEEVRGELWDIDVRIMKNQYATPPAGFLTLADYAPGETRNQIEVSRVLEHVPGLTAKELEGFLATLGEHYELERLENLEREHATFWMTVTVEGVAFYGLSGERWKRVLFRSLKKLLTDDGEDYES